MEEYFWHGMLQNKILSFKGKYEIRKWSNSIYGNWKVRSYLNLPNF